MSHIRQQCILDQLLDHEVATVEEIVEVTHSSPATVRRDLRALEVEGLIERFHGGARLSSKNRFEASFERRSRTNVEAKVQIGAMASSLIKSGETVILDAGTTTLYIIRALGNEGKHVRIFTNSLVIVQEAANYPHLRLSLIGGNIDYTNLATVGPAAVDFLQTLSVDKALIGVNAVSAVHGGMAFDEQNAYVNRAMTAAAAQVYVLGDNSKLGNTATFIAVPLPRISALITDRQVNASRITEFQMAGIDVLGTDA